MPATTVNVRYMVDDVDAAVAFYTTHLGFALLTSAAPAFADVARGDLRLLLSGATSSAGRPMPDGSRPVSGGWNRIKIVGLEREAVGVKLAWPVFHASRMASQGARALAFIIVFRYRSWTILRACRGSFWHLVAMPKVSYDRRLHGAGSGKSARPRLGGPGGVHVSRSGFPAGQTMSWRRSIAPFN